MLIKSPKGPKLSMAVEVVDKNHTKSIITDKRDYLVDGKRLPFVIIENQMHPSFKQIKKIKKSKGKKK